MLGTAQFGMNYGVMNSRGKPSISEVEAILERAHATGLRLLDTAIAYGDSEALLGKIGIQEWDVTSKIPADFDPGVDSLTDLVERSLDRLRVDHLYGFILHEPDVLLTEHGSRLSAELETLRHRGFVERIGLSIYSPDQLDRLLEALQVDLVQAPLNLLDQRFFSTGWLERLKTAGVEFHARSVFLQGLLLTDPRNLPSSFLKHRKTFERVAEWRKAKNLAPVDAALSFVLGLPQVDHVVVGVDNVEQLLEIVNAAECTQGIDPAGLAATELSIIDPRFWARQ